MVLIQNKEMKKNMEVKINATRGREYNSWVTKKSKDDFKAEEEVILCGFAVNKSSCVGATDLKR